jgi:hypothetical protein
MLNLDSTTLILISTWDMFKRKPKKNIETFTMVLVYVLVHPRLGWFTQGLVDSPKPQNLTMQGKLYVSKRPS